MARGVNKVILVGNLGSDPEVRYMPSGGAVTNVNIATSESWTDKASGQKQERTEWHRVVFFNRLAEIAGEYLRKGRQIYVEGSLRTRKWQGQDGQDRYTTEIVASEMQMLGGREGGGMSGGGAPYGDAQGGGAGGGAGGGQPQQQRPRQQSQPQQQQPPRQQAPAQQQPDFGPEPDFDDDIPF